MKWLQPHYIFSLDKQGRVNTCNMIHPEYTPESVLQHHFTEFLLESCHECVAHAHRKALNGRGSVLCPVWYSPEGDRTLLVTMSPWAGGAVICAASVQPLAKCLAVEEEADEESWRVHSKRRWR
jgi:hypothetical protein